MTDSAQLDSPQLDTSLLDLPLLDSALLDSPVYTTPRKRPRNEVAANEATPKKKREPEEKTKLVELLQSDIFRGNVVKERAKHRNDMDYDIHKLSIKENNETHPTAYALCDHENCRGNLKKALFKGIRDNSKSRALHATIVLRHEQRNHINKTKLVYEIAAKCIVEMGLSYEVFDHPRMRELIGLLDENTKKASADI